MNAPLSGGVATAAVVLMAVASSCFRVGSPEEAAETAAAAADAWDRAGQMSRTALELDRLPAYVDAVNAVNAALKASNDAIDAAKAVLHTPESFAPLAARYARAGNLNAPLAAQTLINQGRNAEGLTLIRDYLQEVDREAPDMTENYRNLALAWRVIVRQRQER